MTFKKDLIDNSIILENHFKLTSGRHSQYYINKDAIYCNPFVFNSTIKNMISLISENFIRIEDYDNIVYLYDIITGPAIAGAVLASPIANHFMKSFVYPEKGLNKTMCFNRGYDKVIRNKNVLIVEDIITTGNSVMSTINAIKDCGGKPVGVVCIWNRSGNKSLFDIPLYSLITEEVMSYLPEECPFCEANIPLVDPKKI